MLWVLIRNNRKGTSDEYHNIMLLQKNKKIISTFFVEKEMSYLELHRSTVFDSSV